MFCNGVPHLDKKRVELRQYFLPLKRLRIQRQTLHTGLPILRSAQRENLRNDSTHHGIRKRKRTVPSMSVHRLWAQNHVSTVPTHPPGCDLRSHPDANTNEKIPWKQSVTGKNIIRLKGPSATLNIQERYDGAFNRMVPVDDETLQVLRKKLPPGKSFRSKQGEMVLNNVNTTLITRTTAVDEDQRY